MKVFTRCAIIDRIEGIFDSEKPGIFQLVFKNGTVVYLENNLVVAKLAEAFGATGGDLQEKVKGRKIVFCMDQRQVLRGFTFAEEWEGPEMEEGESLVHDEGGCHGGYRRD